MIFRFCRSNLGDQVYLFLVVLLIFGVGRSGLGGHVCVFHVVMMCCASTCQRGTTRQCKHCRNIRGVHRRFRMEGDTYLPQYFSIYYCMNE